MKNHIIVPLDNSALSAAALPYAELLARALQAEIILVTAVEPRTHPHEATMAQIEQALLATEATLDGERCLLQAGGIVARALADVADPATLIVDVARQNSPALIVMATHGRSGPSRWIMGSVAEQVLRRAHCPTLLLNPAAIAETRPIVLRHPVLVPHDGSDISEQVLTTLKPIVAALQIPVHLLHAVDPAAFYTIVGLAPYNLPTQDAVNDAMKAAEHQFLEVAQKWRKAGLDVDASVGLDGPRHLIVKTSQEGGVGWIAMGSHGRGGISGLVLGSTALAVMRHVSLPVLIVPATAGHYAEKHAAGSTEEDPIGFIVPIA